MKITSSVRDQINESLLSLDVETGFLLGTSKSLDYVNHCQVIPSIVNEKCFYIPDTNYLNCVMEKWFQEEICFCGFLHSHIVDVAELTKDDWDYSERIFDAFDLPFIWYGVVIKRENSFLYNVYKLTKKNDDWIRIASKVSVENKNEIWG